MIAQGRPAAEPTNEEVALALAALGWEVFPCHTPDAEGRCSCRRDCGRDIGKHPRTANGLKDATTDEAKIRHWWGMWPDANVAVRTGEASGIVVIDVDPRGGGREVLAANERQLGPLPITVAARTGGGGDHLVFAWPGRFVRTRSNVAPGVDIRADGGYFVVDPSRHASGNAYAWLNGRSPFDRPPAELPAAWVDFLEPPQRKRPPQSGPVGPDDLSLADGTVAAAVGILQPFYAAGSRHDMALAVAGWMACQGYAEEATERLIEVLAAGDGELTNRLRGVATTYAKYAAGESVLGWSRLRELLPPVTLRALEDLLGTRPRPTFGSNGTGPHPGATNPPPEEDAPHLSDLGNAKRLVAQHGEGLRYCETWGKWLHWDGSRWAVDETGEIVRRAKKTVLGIYAEAAAAIDDGERKALAKHALRSEGRDRIKAMIALAESEPGIPVTPRQLDRDPWLLNVANGVVDLRTGELLPHDRARLITKLVLHPYDPGAPCPTWLAFLDRVLSGKRELIKFVQKAIGYSLTGRTVERALLILWGTGRNGKSTLLDTMLDLLGDYAARTTTDTLLATRDNAIPNDVAALKGKRFVFASEAEEGRRLAEAKVKDLTGGDTISARFMRGEWFDFRPEFKLWLGTNHKPDIKGTDHAIWDRIRLVPFNVRIPDQEQDRGLKDKLLAEAPGILAWAIEGCLDWHRDGLGNPAEVREATSAYRSEMDIIGQFIDDRCTVGPTASATAKELYAAYVSWCGAAGETPISQKAFGQRLAERGFDSARVGKSRARYWVGIELKGRESPGDG